MEWFERSYDDVKRTRLDNLGVSHLGTVISLHEIDDLIDGEIVHRKESFTPRCGDSARAPVTFGPHRARLERLGDVLARVIYRADSITPGLEIFRVDHLGGFQTVGFAALTPELPTRVDVMHRVGENVEVNRAVLLKLGDVDVFEIRDVNGAAPVAGREVIRTALAIFRNERLPDTRGNLGVDLPIVERERQHVRGAQLNRPIPSGFLCTERGPLQNLGVHFRPLLFLLLAAVRSRVVRVIPTGPFDDAEFAGTVDEVGHRNFVVTTTMRSSVRDDARTGVGNG